MNSNRGSLNDKAPEPFAFALREFIVSDAFADAEHIDGDEENLVKRIRGCLLSELRWTAAGDAFEHTGEVLWMLKS